MTTTRILAALDGSPASESVVEHLETLLKRQDADLTLLRVLPKEGTAPHRAAAAYLAEVAERLTRKGALLDTKILVGRPAEQIAAFAAGGGFDLLLLCSRGKAGLKRMLFGSTAEEVLRLASTPVLVVPPKAERPAPSLYRRILVPHDGSHRSAAVLRPAAELATAQEAKLTFVTVVSPTRKEDLPVETVAANLFREQKELQKRGLDVEVAVLYGDPAERVLAFAEENGTDLIALSTHGRTGLDRARYGSVAEALLRKGRRPMLVVRTAAIPKARGSSAAGLKAKHRAYERQELGRVTVKPGYGG